MSSFNDIATNLDQRLTALETYFNSLTTKGCPRATCGVHDLNTNLPDYITSPTEGQVVSAGDVTYTINYRDVNNNYYSVFLSFSQDPSFPEDNTVFRSGDQTQSSDGSMRYNEFTYSINITTKGVWYMKAVFNPPNAIGGVGYSSITTRTRAFVVK